MMDYLYDIIDELLQQNGFENVKSIDDNLQEIGSFKFYASSKDTPEQYLLIEKLKSSEIPSVEEFLKLQLVIFKLLAGCIDEPGFTKNVSFLLTIDVCNSEDLNDNLEKFILKIEEDPYCFKKLVLPYDSRVTKEIILECEKSKQSIPEYLTKVINDVTSFSSFVEGKNSIYKLISQLYIKLPFVSLPLKDIGGSNSLAEELSKIIEDKHFTSLWEKVCAFDIEDSNKLSINTDGEELDKLLMLLDVQEEKE
jgi:hypothetical protein